MVTQRKRNTMEDMHHHHLTLLHHHTSQRATSHPATSNPATSNPATHHQTSSSRLTISLSSHQDNLTIWSHLLMQHLSHLLLELASLHSVTRIAIRLLSCPIHCNKIVTTCISQLCIL